MKVLHNTLFKYLLFGGVSALIEFIAFAVLHQFVSIYIASLTSFIVGLASSYLLNKFVVFNKKDKSIVEVFQFVSLGLINSQLSSLLTVWLSTLMPSVVAKIVTMGAIAAWNFVVMNKLIFNKN